MTNYKYFTTEELACRCGCGQLNIKSNFMERIVRSRAFAKRLCGKHFLPNTHAQFIVTSACRCEAHNKAVGGVTNSRHISTPDRGCTAMDIAFKDTKQLLIIVVALFLIGKFTHIGINLEKNFIHVDDKSAWLWFY